MAEKYDKRRAKPHQEITTTDPATGSQVTLKADASGLLSPKDATQKAMADAYDLPVAREGKPDKAAEKTTTTRGTPPAKATAEPEPPQTTEGGA